MLYVMLDGRMFVVHFTATPATRVVVAATRVKVLKVEYAGVAQSTQID